MSYLCNIYDGDSGGTRKFPIENKKKRNWRGHCRRHLNFLEYHGLSKISGMDGEQYN